VRTQVHHCKLQRCLNKQNVCQLTELQCSNCDCSKKLANSKFSNSLMLELQIAKSYYWTSNFEELPAFQPIVHLGQKKVTTVWITFVQKYLTLFWGFEFQTVVIWTVAAFIALIRLQLFVINQRIQTVVIKIPTAENIFGKLWTVANFYQYNSTSCPCP